MSQHLVLIRQHAPDLSVQAHASIGAMLDSMDFSKPLSAIDWAKVYALVKQYGPIVIQIVMAIINGGVIPPIPPIPVPTT